MSLKLVKKVENREINIFNISDSESYEVLDVAINSNNYSLLARINEPCIGKLANSESPGWLKCEFEDNIWYIEFIDGNKKHSKKCKIDFNVTFGSEQLKLTDPRFASLLTGIKLWIISIQDQRNFSRELTQANTRYLSLRTLLRFIDFLFLNSDQIYLPQLEMKCIDSDLIKSYLALEANGGINAIYGFEKQLKALSKVSEDLITDEDVSKFEDKFSVDILNIRLGEEYCISAEQQKKLVVFLYNKSMYKGSGFGKHTTSGNVNRKKLALYLYEGKCLLSDNVYITPPIALAIFKPYLTWNEHKRLNVHSGSGLYKNAHESLRVIKALALVSDFEASPDIDLSLLCGLSTKSVNLFLEREDKGRFKTLPPALVFKSIRNAFEYSFENIDHIFKSMLTFLKKVPEINDRVRTLKNDGSYTAVSKLALLKRDTSKIIDTKTFDMGVRVHSISSKDENYHSLVRENFGLVECYSVLMGSLQVATGSLLARRSGELIDLMPFGNLYPDTAPLENKSTEYFVYFDNRKSGISGEEAQRDRIKRPIPHSIATFIWKTEQFNKELLVIESHFSNFKKFDDMSLFNSIDKVECRVNSINSLLLTRHLDYFCDYFETPTVLVDGEVTRYYLRQHQLRRFFALMFFWSKGFDGLDTLRHFLGHTDVSHLFHYITESVTGGVLNGVKASTLVSKHAKLSVENYSDLINLIKLRYGADDAEFLSSTEASEDYADAEYTVPPIELINKQARLESHVLDLLEMKIITLEPEFFTVQGADGTSTQDFTLVLKIIKD